MWLLQHQPTLSIKSLWTSWPTPADVGALQQSSRMLLLNANCAVLCRSGCQTRINHAIHKQRSGQDMSKQHSHGLCGGAEQGTAGACMLTSCLVWACAALTVAGHASLPITYQGNA
jgi:hypothetical protein